MSELEKSLFIKAILQGYIYFRDVNDKNKIHKGFVIRYEEELDYFNRHLEVAYGISFYFNHLVNGKYELDLEDCDEELLRNPKKHPEFKECYNYGFKIMDYNLDFEHYGWTWALTKEELTNGK